MSWQGHKGLLGMKAEELRLGFGICTCMLKNAVTGNHLCNGTPVVLHR